MPVIDFSQVKSAKFEPVPEGVYELEIVNTEWTTSKAGNDMLEVKFVPQGLEGDRYVMERFTVPTPSDMAEGNYFGLPFLKALLETLSFNLDGNVELKQVAAQLVDERVMGRVIIEEYKTSDGETRQSNRIRNYSPVTPA